MKISQKIYDLCCILEEKKAEEIIVCDTQKLSNAVDFYVIATATSSMHAKGILDYLEEQIQSKDMFLCSCREGFNTSKWLVLDVGEGFVHVFTKDLREHYNLEKLVNEGSNVKSFEKIKKDFQKQLKAENKIGERLAKKAAKPEDKPKDKKNKIVKK